MMSPATRRRLPVMVTASLLVVMIVSGYLRYPKFDGQAIYDLFVDNSFLLAAAVGATFVILSGGIDLSVGAVAGFSTMFSAWLIVRQGWTSWLVILIVLAIGTLAGLLMGAAIHYLEIQPFIVTLAGLFLFRGLCFVIDDNSISIRDPFIQSIAESRLYLPGGTRLSLGALISLAVLLVAVYVLHYRRFGRQVYAVGGNEQSALLMGAPVARTKLAVYAVSGFCSAFAGVLYIFYIQSGDPSIGVGLELDAIAAVVIGGTLLTGGSGTVLGTLLGVLVFGMVKTILNFEGTLSSWWVRIFVGSLLLAFILLQRLMGARKTPAPA